MALAIGGAVAGRDRLSRTVMWFVNCDCDISIVMPLQSQTPFKPTRPPVTRAAVQKLFPLAAFSVIDPLATTWDEVVHRIIGEILNFDGGDKDSLHVNVREEMALEIAQLIIWLGAGVVKKRLTDRDINIVDVEQERIDCLGPKGTALISGTARLAYAHIWSKVMADAKQKSKRAFEREANPRQVKLAIQPVETNHFIPRSFIRDFWAANGKITRWRRVNDGWSPASLSFGQWGFRSNLYSDWLEAYFSLLEGDAKLPIQKLLEIKPLNAPERNSLVGFLMMQILRNPTLMTRVQQGVFKQFAQLPGIDDPAMLRGAYETLFRNNDLYHRLAHPVMRSRWAIVKCGSPVFVLPDTFGAHGDFGDGLRLVAPLTPSICFVTLPGTEAEKRVVPFQLEADEQLACWISDILVRSTEKECLSHPDFQPDERQIVVTLDFVLKQIEAAIEATED